MIIPVLLALLISLAHLYSRAFANFFKGYNYKFISFTAGLSVSYLFLELLPLLYSVVPLIDRYVFVFILLGFSLFHLTEKYILQNPGKQSLFSFVLIHDAGFALYYLVIGILLAVLASSSLLAAILLFIPVVMHSMLSSLSLTGSHKSATEKPSKLSLKLPFLATLAKKSELFLFLFPVIGSILPNFFNLSEVLLGSFLSFTGGIFLFIIVRESIPSGKYGKPSFFIYGMISYLIMQIFIWYR